ncbi:MAG: hypothetical protein GX764_04160, partial [Firmicutes bacterium]|nr:hypothetical protein [Bacillota bacterium]
AEQCRLIVSPDDLLFELENLNPGDRETRTLTLKNDGEKKLYFHVSMDWLEGDPGVGELGDLYEQLLVTLFYKGKEVYCGSMKGLDGAFAELQEPKKDYMGVLEPGESEDLKFSVYLPGPETGNEFQGSSLKTEIIIKAFCERDEEDDDEHQRRKKPRPQPEPDDPEDEEIEISLEPPGGEPESKPGEEADPEPLPKTGELPKTGAFPIILNISSLMLIAAGLALRRRQ